MKSISIKNLRSIKDSGSLQIKPLTILLGQNSSGKSTLLRFFPLMKQTINSRRNEAILWYNSESVDFGNFEKAINRNANPKILELDFEFLLSHRQLANRYNKKIFYSSGYEKNINTKLNVRI